MIATILMSAFLAGLAFRKLGYPPLLGYLLAGFGLNAVGIGDTDMLAPIAEMGVTLLLFTIGLKLRVVELARPYILGPAVLHMIVVIPLTAAVIMLAGNVYSPLAFDNQMSPWMLAFALSFSSTVFAIKMFDERGENNSFYAAIAIGVLVIQDVMAVVYLVVMSSEPPSLWALGILLLPLLKMVWQPLLSRLLAILGHGELQLLFGFVAALGAYELFELLHLKGGLGALLMGVMLGSADNVRSRELYGRLVAWKNLFLIGFFLQIGFYGLPTIEIVAIALVLGLLILLRPIIYFSFFTLFKLRARTAWLAGIGLFTYSEFGLIVASIATAAGYIPEEWMITLALATAVSFFIATPVNKLAHKSYRKHAEKLNTYEKKQRLRAEKIEQLGGARIVILGMGRVGSGAYEYLSRLYPGAVIGVDENFDRSVELKARGIKCVHGDASDRDFWEQTRLHNREMILASLSNHQENLTVVTLARELGYQKTLAVTARFEDEKKRLEDLGCISFNVYADVGKGFAEHVLDEELPDSPFKSLQA